MEYYSDVKKKKFAAVWRNLENVMLSDISRQRHILVCGI